MPMLSSASPSDHGWSSAPTSPAAHPWPGIEIRHLVALAAVARAGSFRGAADALGYAQSAVSQRILQLETMVGRRLLDRTRGARVVRLTEAGEMLLEHVHDIVAQFQAAHADLTAAGDSRTNELRVGFCGAAATRLMPPIISRLQEQAPDTSLSLTDVTRDASLFRLVERGALDLAIADLPLEPGPFEALELLADPWVLVVHVSSPIASRDTPLSVTELAALPLIALDSWRPRTSIEAWFTTQSIAPQIKLRAINEITAQALVAVDLGVTILPRLAVDEHNPALAVIPLGPLAPRRSLALFWHRERRHLALLHQFSSAAQEAVHAFTDADVTSFASPDDQAPLAHAA